ncbi:putative mitochondrial protein, partial [Mucuna pruriens]
MKALYGLKQAPRAWNSRIDKYFQHNGFIRCQHKYFEDFKKVMSYEFEMTNIGLMSYYLGLEVKQMNNGIFVSQESYAKKVLEKFKIFDCNPVNTLIEGSLKLSKFDSGEKEDSTLFRNIVGSLSLPLYGVSYLISYEDATIVICICVCLLVYFKGSVAQVELATSLQVKISSSKTNSSLESRRLAGEETLLEKTHCQRKRIAGESKSLEKNNENARAEKEKGKLAGKII